ncbi:hypothetical protein MXB_2599 [Myxobolus squamalis]|nr:hypothetical protein MXB_2599 [Myxobolus squamalis]
MAFQKYSGPCCLNEILLPSDADLIFNLKVIEQNEEELLKKASSTSLQECSKLTRQLAVIYRFPDCHKMSFLASFILHAHVESIDFFMERFPAQLLVCYSDVVKSLHLVLHLIIEPYYSKLCYRMVPKSDEDVHESSIKIGPEFNFMIFKVLKILGHNIHEDCILFTKIIRIFTFIVKESSRESFSDLQAPIVMSISCCFLPALTQMESNCVASEELWSLIKLFPYNIRFRFYSHLKNVSYLNVTQLVRSKLIVTKNTKFICKRITKDTVKQSGRQLGKLTHSNPIIVISEVVNQICSFDTMIIPIVECLKYLTPLSFDILSYTLIEYLSANSVTLSAKITSIPDVIQNIGNFAATVMRKYIVPLTGILQYIANQLKAHNPLDLIVLREILHKMAGVEENHLSAQQIDLLSGSDTLQEESGVGFSSKSLKKYAFRLRDSLCESNLVFPLFFMMAQQRDRFVIDKSLADIHIKMSGNLYDQCHKTFVQYGRFISKYIYLTDYHKNLPSSLSVLQSEFGLNVECIFFLIRHVFRNDAISIPKNLSYIQAINELLDKYLKSLSDVINSKISQNVPLKLVCIFWLLDLYDIYLPNQKYDESIAKSSLLITSFEDSKDLDRDTQKMHVAYIKQWLFGILNDSLTKSNKNDFLNSFFQLCVYPRCIFSPIDSIFSAEFLFTLHHLRCFTFNSLSFLDKILGENMHIVSSFSESEAYNFGLFLNKIWEYLCPWHASKTIFEQNCSKHPGFVILSRNEQDKYEGYEYDNFRHLMYKWQYKQTKSFIFGLESKDYVQIRNSIIILTRVSSTFPRVINLKKALEKRVEKLVEEEKDKRPDLYALVTCYSGILRNLKDTLVDEAQFHHKEQPKDLKIKVKDNESVKSNIQHIPSLLCPLSEDPNITVNSIRSLDSEDDCRPVENKLAEEHPKKYDGFFILKSTVEILIRGTIPDKIHVFQHKSNSIEKVYALRNLERKRTNEENDDLRSKRRKDIENDVRNNSNSERTAIVHIESSENLKKHTYNHHHLSSPESRDKPISKNRNEPYSTRRMSREDPEYIRNRKDPKKRRL